jgi:hypothetical protein
MGRDDDDFDISNDELVAKGKKLPSKPDPKALSNKKGQPPANSKNV